MKDSNPYQSPVENGLESSRKSGEHLGVIAFALSALIFTFVLPDSSAMDIRINGLPLAVITLPICCYLSVISVRTERSWSLAFGHLAVAVQLWTLIRISLFVFDLLSL